MSNPNCDGDHCFPNGNGQVRVLPTGGQGNLILCYQCYLHEMQFRRERNLDLGKDNQFCLPKWEDLEIYDV